MIDMLRGLLFVILYILVILMVASIMYAACKTAHGEPLEVFYGALTFIATAIFMVITYKLIEHIDNDPL